MYSRKSFRLFWLMLLALMAFTTPAKAQLIDFTSLAWHNAVNIGGGTTATLGGVTLTATGGTFTINNSSSEISGCAGGQPGNGLSCAGDGIGINNDEITEGGQQGITITFDTVVDVNDILLLDLFGSEQTGEIAIINGTPYEPPPGNGGFPGGFFATGFAANGITEIFLTGNLDYFSDYALAGIDVTPVPLPAAMFLFASALLGLMGFRRFSNK